MHRSQFRRPLSSIGRRVHHPSRALALAVFVWLGACGDPQPPVACGTIPQQTLHVRESGTVTPCFEDPEMGPIRLSAESGAPEIVRAAVSGDRVTFHAVSPGAATVRVTASDSDSLTTQIHFDVLVPNRPPERRRTMLDIRLQTGRSSAILLSDYFYEPDDEVLTYSAEFSDVSVATGTVAGETLVTAGGNAGTTTATVTATDPGGLSVSQTFGVSVLEPVVFLRDDFDSEESLGAWTVADSSHAAVEDGMLWLENVVSGYLGLASQDLSATGWEVTAAMGNATADAWAGLMVGADHARFSAYLIQIGADGNSFQLGDTDYRFFIFDNDGPFWTYADGWYGQSDAIADVGDLTEVSMTIDGGVLTVTAGSTELVRLDLTGTVLSADATFVGLATWPSGETTGNRGFFDRVELTGLELEDAGPDLRPSSRSIDLAAPLRRIGPRDRIRPLDGTGRPIRRAPTGKE